MTSSYLHKFSQHDARAQTSPDGAHAQRGVVLIIALILLVVISLLAVTSMRNVGSAEMLAGNVRTTELATQSAELALRHCEASAIRFVRANDGLTTSEATYSTTFPVGNVLPINTEEWKKTVTWDSGAGTATFVLPSNLVGGTATFKRAPECMIELLTSATGSTGATVRAPASFIVTARGFGPEVATGTGRPQGSVVWLQSTIAID